MPAECLICQEQRLAVPLPGGHLLSTDNVVAFHVPPLPADSDVFLGYLMTTPRRHAADFGELTDEEAAAMGRSISILTRALKALGAARVYTLTVGHGVAHLHVHLVPRWPETPDDVSWLDTDTWEGARRGDFDEATRMSEQVRAVLRA